MEHRTAMIALHPTAKAGLVRPLSLAPDDRSNWRGGETICRQVSGEYDAVLLMGQDSFSTSLARGAERMLAAFPFTICVFPRLGCTEQMLIPPGLADKVQFVKHVDDVQCSSADVRGELAAGELPDATKLNLAICEYIRRHQLYGCGVRLDKGPARRLVLMGGPGTGKTVVAAALAAKRRLSHLCPGDWYREAIKPEHPEFYSLIESHRSSNMAVWQSRLKLFLKLCEAAAVTACQNSALVVEEKRVEEIDGRTDVAGVIVLTASARTMHERVSARARQATDDEHARVRIYNKNWPKVEAALHQRQAVLDVWVIDTTNLSLDEVIKRALQCADLHGMAGDGDAVMAVDVREVVRAALARLPQELGLGENNDQKSLRSGHRPPSPPSAALESGKLAEPSGGDVKLECRDCQSEFIFLAVEQQSYADKGFKSKPARCKECRAARRAQSFGRPVRSHHGHGQW